MLQKRQEDQGEEDNCEGYLQGTSSFPQSGGRWWEWKMDEKRCACVWWLMISLSKSIDYEFCL